jgi:hypothetical protein
MQFKEAQRVRDEQARVKAALKATEDARKGIAKTKTVDGKKRVVVKYQGEELDVDTNEITPLLKAVETAEALTDPKERLKESTKAYSAVDKYLYGKSRVSKEYLDRAIEGLEGTGEEVEDVKNPLYRPYQSGFEDDPRTEYDLDKGEAPRAPSINPDAVRGFVTRELAKMKAIRDLTEEKKDLDVDVAKFNLEKKEDNFWDFLGNETVSLRQGGIAVRTDTRNDRALNEYKRQLLEIDNKMYEAEQAATPRTGREGSGFGQYGLQPDPAYKPSRATEIKSKAALLDLRKQKKDLEEKARLRFKELQTKLDKAQAPAPTYQAGKVTVSGAGERLELRNTQVEVAKSIEEQTDDEYAIMTNQFGEAGVPDSFTKEAFYQMKGIIRPVSVSLGGGHRFVSYGGESKIVTDVQSQGMSLADEERMWKAGEFAKARNLNGVTANGFRFSGEVRVGDIDKANTVKNEIFTSTRALSSVDRMLDIAENASLFDKLLPTEISGIAQSLTNAAQSANRTEIGGSGAWSNQDQVYMDKVIRDPSSGFNAIFSTQAIASLREYRSRLLAGMVDKGTAYGFAFERGGNNDGLDSIMSQFRVRFNSALARNMTEQEAFEYAKGTLYANGSE